MRFRVELHLTKQRPAGVVVAPVGDTQPFELGAEATLSGVPIHDYMGFPPRTSPPRELLTFLVKRRDGLAKLPLGEEVELAP